MFAVLLVKERLKNLNLLITPQAIQLDVCCTSCENKD
jgi:hypothetical protein